MSHLHDNELTIDKVAIELDVPINVVKEFLEVGILKAHKIKGILLITRKSFDKYKEFPVGRIKRS